MEGSGVDVEPAVIIMDEEIKNFERMIALLKQYKKKLVQKKPDVQAGQEAPAKAEDTAGVKKRGKDKVISKSASMAEIDSIVQREVKAGRNNKK